MESSHRVWTGSFCPNPLLFLHSPTFMAGFHNCAKIWMVIEIVPYFIWSCHIFQPLICQNLDMILQKWLFGMDLEKLIIRHMHKQWHSECEPDLFQIKYWEMDSWTFGQKIELWKSPHGIYKSSSFVLEFTLLLVYNVLQWGNCKHKKFDLYFGNHLIKWSW